MAQTKPQFDHLTQSARNLPRLARFQGFAPPTSNTTFTPNQFFDVVLPNASRGCVRLVAFMIRKTLGWCDADGNPQEEQILTSYSDLVQHAGINRDMIRPAIDEALAGHFIRCVRPGKPSLAGQAPVTALYELSWDGRREYVKDPALFRGFFEHEGNRTDIPNQFFDEIIPNEPLSVIKVVGAVIRFSIGFQAKHGRRRQRVALSYSQIQRYTGIASRTTLSQAVQRAIEQNFIIRIQEGIFSPFAEEQTATTYGLKWIDPHFYLPTGRKSVPASEPEDRSEKRTRTGRITGPENRSEKRTTYKRNRVNETSKQQQRGSRHAVAVAHEEGFQLLLKQGFSERDAKHLAETHETAIIRDQVNWLERRNPTSSRLGLLRRAIEENWEEPTAARDESETDAQGASPGAIFAACYYAGFHGSDDEPAAAPSTNDIKQAERFIEQISEMTTGEPPVAEWGRALGRLHAEAQPSSDAPVISCVVALRRHGDALKQKLRTDWERKRQEAIDQAKAAHRTKHRGVYSDYLRNCEAEIKTSDPDGYAAFETHRAEERARIERNRFFSDERRVQQLAAFDRVERRLKDFQEFPQFEDVLSFEAWDAKLNSEPFREDEVTS